MTTATAGGGGSAASSGPSEPSGTPGASSARLDDGTLVVRAREGDVHAFEVLVQRYETQMYRLAVRMLGNRGDAEDVVQEVFLAAWRRLPEIREGAALPGWLYRTTTNRCLNALRARRPRAEVDLDLTESRLAEGEPERAAETAEQVRALTSALQQLTPQQRAAWLLREVHGRSYAEIAATLGVSAAAVRGRIARSRAELAEAMQPWR